MSEEPQPHDVGDLAAPDFEADTVPATDNNAHGVVISLLAKALGLLAAAGRFVAQFFAWIRRWWTRLPPP